MSRQLHAFATALLVVSSSAILGSPHVLADGESLVEVTVTNITRGQIISPVVVASHSSALSPLFDLGSPASDELAQVAEDANLEPLIAMLSADPAVYRVEVLPEPDSPIPPGASRTVLLEVPGVFDRVTMAAMLVTTNDAFFALRGVRVPRAGQRTYLSPAYDAGSETNNEACADIPGPPCGNPGERETSAAEGYVHIHAGIHGIGDLDPSDQDWRNPVAEINIRRIRGDDEDD